MNVLKEVRGDLNLAAHSITRDALLVSGVVKIAELRAFGSMRAIAGLDVNGDGAKPQ